MTSTGGNLSPRKNEIDDDDNKTANCNHSNSNNSNINNNNKAHENGGENTRNKIMYDRNSIVLNSSKNNKPLPLTQFSYPLSSESPCNSFLMDTDASRGTSFAIANNDIYLSSQQRRDREVNFRTSTTDYVQMAAVDILNKRINSDKDDSISETTTDTHSYTSSFSSHVMSGVPHCFSCRLCRRPRGRVAIPLGYSSLYLFSGENVFRIFLLNLSRHKFFEAIVIIIILMNCVLLAINDPRQPNETYQNNFDIFFTAAFSTEMVIKVIGMGFIQHKGAYLRSSWNVLDFIIIMLSYITLVPGVGNYTALRTLRVLRPLRSINVIPPLKTIVKGLLHSLKGLANVALLSFFIFIVFSIVGVQLWMGQFNQRCSKEGTILVDMKCSANDIGYSLTGRPCPPGYDCIPYQNLEGTNYYVNFDNIFSALFVVFTSITLENWSIVMRDAILYVGWYSVLYFILLIMIGSYFVLNLALAVISFEFELAKNRILEKMREEAEEDERELLEESSQIMDMGSSTVAADRAFILGDNGTTEFVSLNAKSAEELHIKNLRRTVPGLLILNIDQVEKAVPPNDVNSSDGIQEMMKQPMERDLEKEEVVGLYNRVYAFFSHWYQSNLHRMSWFLKPWFSFRRLCYCITEGDLQMTHDYAIQVLRSKAVQDMSDLNVDLGPEEIPEPKNTWFERLIVFCVLLNTIVMAAEHYEMSDLQTSIEEISNLVFTIVFAIELGLRNFSLGITGYWFELANTFDGFITIISVVEIAIAGNHSTFSVLRAFRLLRIFRLMKSLPSLRNILAVMVVGIRETAYLNLIFLLYLFIATLVGMQLLGASYNPPNDLRNGYDNFLWAFYSVFQTATRDNWPDNANSVMFSQGAYYILYFIACVFCGDIVLLNLYLAVLIGCFQSVAESTNEKVKSIKTQSHERKKEIGAGSIGTLVPEQARRLLRLVDHKLRLVEVSGDRNTKYYLDEGEFDVLGGGGKALCEMMSKVEDDEICNLCGEAKIQPFPPPSKLIVPMTPDELHNRMCARISLRKMKKRALNHILQDIGVDNDILFRPNDPYMGLPTDREKTVDTLQNIREHRCESVVVSSSPPTPTLVDDVFGKAWEAGLLLTSNADDYYDIKTWDPIINLLVRENMLLELRVGEEQVGQSLVAYTSANIPANMFTNGGISLWLFGPKNKLRTILTAVITDPKFDKCILVLIIASSALMVFDNPRNDQPLWYSTVSRTFTCLFAVEALCKIIAWGFILHPTAYLRNGWNVLDGFIVTVSIVSWIVASFASSNALTALKVLRTLRVMRPLRVINRYRGIKMVVSTLLLSMKPIANISLIAGTVFLVFSILFCQLFTGKLYYCTDSNVTIKAACVGSFLDIDTNTTVAREWTKPILNFDNTAISFVTLFKCATLDQLGDTFWQIIDATDIDQSPVKRNNPAMGMLMVVFVAVCCWFLLNMFVGVILHSFTIVKCRMDGSSMLTNEQKLWVETQRMMLNFRPQPQLKPMDSLPGRICFEIARNHKFELATTLIIFLNVIFIAMEHYNQPDSLTRVLKVANLIFVSLFFLEAAIKITALGRYYFHVGWNCFDFFIVLIGILGIFFDDIIPINFAVLRALRVFRIMRMLALIKQAKDVRILLETLWYSIPSLVNIGTFLLLILFVYSVLGMQLFARLKRTHGLDDDNNFENFGNSFLFMIQLATMDYWSVVMEGTMNTEDCGDAPLEDCGNMFSPLFFMSFIVLASWVLVNLFIAVIIDNFNTTMQLDKSTLKVAHLKKFTDAWSLYDPHATLLIETKDFPNLLLSLQPPLGISRSTDRKAVMSVADNYLIIEHSGIIHFVETMVPMARKVLGVSFTEAELRAHEDHWRTQFPSLSELMVLRYRAKRVTVAQYFGATYLAAAFRRRAAYRYVNGLREDKREALIQWYDNHGVPEAERHAVYRLDDAAAVRQEEEHFAMQPDSSFFYGDDSQDNNVDLAADLPDSQASSGKAQIRAYSKSDSHFVTNVDERKVLSKADIGNLLGFGR